MMLWCSALGAQERVVVSDSVQTDNVTGNSRQQKITTLQDVNKVGVSPELKEYFMSLLPGRDTTYTKIEKEGRKDKFFKRFSFHTNLLGWALLLPNAAVEIDLSQTPRNHYSILLHGMFNGKGKNTFGTSFIFNARSARVEGRKYWRTGKLGKNRRYHYEYEKLVTDPNRVDSAGKALFNADSTRGWLYNTYHKVRRNVLSGRTVSKPRDWRAYYLGVYAGVDDWNVAFGGNGKQGEGIFAGLSAGWSIPIFPQQFPKEGSLDLELGINVGVKAVRYEAYTREDDTGHYVHDPGNSQPNWKICPFPVVQDIHVSLVWRMRGIKNKVDRSLIDDYWARIDSFNARRDTSIARRKRIRNTRERKAVLAPLEEELKKTDELLIVIEKADTSGKAAPMLRLALALARRDSAEMMMLGSKEEKEFECELIVRELEYYSSIALGMVNQSLLPTTDKDKKSKKTENKAPVVFTEAEAIKADKEAKVKSKKGKRKSKKDAEPLTADSVAIEPIQVEPIPEPVKEELITGETPPATGGESSPEEEKPQATEQE